ncbi:protein asteroid-like [Andrena cerasifolii]|uniref:protein asteroid-like n=1 Tax=Andrena cerasifolii TaxID=2819439 RepID=UPI004037E954
MGIQGLTTFINNRSDRYLEYYELHDTYLVIDGNSIGCQIYILYAKCNCAFGGDYDKYAQYVSNFFDDLLKCNITPLVLIDGGCEDKKLQTVIKRTKDKIRVASSFTPFNQRLKFFPVIIKEVFKDVIREKNIRHVQCLFEADNAIAAVARILNCPVLSYDSDFYIYGTLYVPFDTLEKNIVKCPNGQGYMKCCKVYRVEHLLNSFRGLDQSMLPLAAVLLGNDYIDNGMFKNFFQHLNLRVVTGRRLNQQQCRIEATFIWLSKYTLDKAIIGILCRLPKSKRQRILNIIETNINVYTNASAQILVPLGFSREYVARVTTHSVNRVFKLDEDVNNLTYIEETCDRGDCETSEEEDEEDSDIRNFKESECFNNALVNNLPEWFINDFLMARYPEYFMDLIMRCLYVCPVQVEDYCRPSSIVISLKIISVIYRLLKSGISDEADSMNYMIRNCNKIARYTLDDTDTILSYKLPALSNLREIPLTIRREILNDTLEIADQQCINEFPPEWMLYIACAKYWIKQQEPNESRKCYMYAVFVCMLFNIIDSRIGKHRLMHNFQTKYGHLIESVQQNRKACNYNPSYSMTVELIEAYNGIDDDDCLLAAPFFISHFAMDGKLHRNPKKFNRSIVHTFAEFQSCVIHTMHLNALLGYPYTQIKVANLFNGTLLYNLCNNFITRHNIEGYIKTVFQNSPSLLRLFNILLLKVTPLETNSYRKPKKMSKRKKKSAGHKEGRVTEHITVEDDSLQESKFYDANNPFSLLNCI